MIVVRLMGGLGNQMFQYALGRHLALRRGAELKLDLTWYARRERKGRGAERPYALHHFAVAAPVARRWEVPYTGSSRWVRLAAQAARRLPAGRLAVVREDGLPFDPAVLDAPDGSYLFGYWVTERYFSEVAGVIRSDFTVQSPPEGLNRALLDEITSTESVSVHVRRGDYAHRLHTREYHGLLSPSYYEAAVEAVLGHTEAPRFFVFSDDPAWCRENLAFPALPSPATFVDHNGVATAFEDLRLMSHCRHHVIANSTFSWWAAWLNPDPAKRVYAPRRWLSGPGADTRDVVPPGWSRLDA